jgi:hypothetical protein
MAEGSSSEEDDIDQIDAEDIMKKTKKKSKDAVIEEEEKLVDTLKFDPLRDIKQMREWALKFKKNIAAACRVPADGFAWAAECEKKDNLEQLKDAGGRPQLDAKLNTALLDSGVVSGELARKVKLMEEELALNGEMLGGRQIAWMVFQYYKIGKIEGALYEFKDLMNTKMYNNNLETFQHDWDSVLIGMVTAPDKETLESMYRENVEKDTNPKWKAVLDMYDHDIRFKGNKKCYDTLYEYARMELQRRTEHRMRADMNNKQHDPGWGMAFGGKGRGRGRPLQRPQSAPECRNWVNSGQCAKGDFCPYQHVPFVRGRPKGRGRGKGKGKSKSPGGKNRMSPGGTRRGPTNRSPGGRKWKQRYTNGKSMSQRGTRHTHPARGKTRR